MSFDTSMVFLYFRKVETGEGGSRKTGTEGRLGRAGWLGRPSVIVADATIGRSMKLKVSDRISKWIHSGSFSQ